MFAVYSVPGRISCQLCDPGRVANETGMNQCIPCDPGQL